MIVNRKSLFIVAPIKNMLHEKHKANGVSHGMSEAGYDIRIKQDIEFIPVGDQINAIVGTVRYPNTRFVLASAMEEFDMPSNLVGVVHDKSTWARRRISVFNTVIEPGWKGFLTLEIAYHGNDPLTIPAGSGIAQVLFHTTTDDASYTGRYQNQKAEPVPAMDWE